MVDVMQIQQSTQSAVGMVKDIPSSLLAGLSVGQRLDAIVVTPAVAAEIVKLQVTDDIMEIRTPVPLKQGQMVQLEIVKNGGKLMLQLVLPTQADVYKTATREPPLPLKIGQNIAVEVVKVLADNRLLVTTKDVIKTNSNPATVASKPTKTIELVPKHFDIDITQLNKAFKIGDKLALEVVTVKPLTIQVKHQVSQREQVIIDRLRHLLPQQTLTQPNLKTVARAQQNPQFPESVQQHVRQLLQHVIDKPVLMEPKAFKQALQNSGVFMEKQLLTTPTAHQQDFKANLLRLVSAIESVINTSQQTSATTKKLDVRALPNDVRQALIAVTKTSSDVTKLPAQVQAALTTTGRTPTQLLASLLSTTSSASALTGTTSALPSTAEQLALLSQGSKLTAALEQMTAKPKAMLAEITVLRELLREVEGVHNKLQFNQLAMLKDPESPSAPTVWLIDMPLKDKGQLEMLQLRIEQHHQQQYNDDEDTWSVQLTLDTQNLGPLQASITMHADDVKVILRAERPASAELLEANIDLLNHGLNRLGVNVSSISCHCGAVNQVTAIEPYISQSTSLVDISV